MLKKSSFLSLLCFRPYERGIQQYVWNTDLRAREERVGESGVKSNSEEKFSPETRPFFSGEVFRVLLFREVFGKNSLINNKNTLLIKN